MWSETLPYRKYREPYLPNFFSETAKLLNLTRQDRLLDIACGTGTLAFAFAPYVGSLTGVDIEQPMIDAARAVALQTGIDIKLICAGVDAIEDDIGTFQLVTLGKAHWYLPREATCAKLEQWVAPGGKVAFCVATTDNKHSGPWAPLYRQLRGRSRPKGRTRLTPKEFMADSRFVHIGTIRCSGERMVTIDELLMRALAFHLSTPGVLGSEKDIYLSRIRDALEPFAIDGKLHETLVTLGDVFARP